MEENREQARQQQQMEENPVQEDKSSQQIIIEKTDCRGEDKQEETSKKPKQGSKQSLKAAKPTIPQPFTLSTEKRMSRERRGSVDFSADISKKTKPRQRHGSMDFNNSYSQPRLSRSASLSNKDRLSPNAGDTSDINRANSLHGTSKIISRPQVKAAEHVESKIGSAQKMKNRTPLIGAESKQLKGNDKKQRVEGMESSNLQKSSTFKALPLPKFYQKKDSPPKSETKKMPETNSKSPTLIRSIKKAESSKIEDKGKGPSKTVTNGAKETISKLLRSTRKVLNTSKVTTKGIVSSA
ncbi:hypothetical protein CCACVL1_15079 [Corchorus capsularis]|uniref:Uncharacterized protein n=1 Tax=Corchorus capsularis TaxID=210143 RepID=A0A1R3I3Z0_COCAP|nr:hypothetical protein CCACVL1_15079 [Corchorus capsularis]